MGWRERLFCHHVNSQKTVCTISKSGSYIGKQRTVHNLPTARLPSSSDTQNATEIAVPSAIVPLTTVPSSKEPPASSVLAASFSTPSSVIDIDGNAFRVASVPPTKENFFYKSDDLLSITSNNSSPICRICQDKRDEAGNDTLIAPCGCAGSTKYVHQDCLDKWTAVKGSTHCEICRAPYDTQYVKLSCWTTSGDSTFISTVAILVLLMSVTAVGAYLLIHHAKLTISTNPPLSLSPPTNELEVHDQDSDIWVAVSLLVSGIVGLILFFPYVLYCCIIMLHFRVRRRRMQARQHQVHV